MAKKKATEFTRLFPSTKRKVRKIAIAERRSHAEIIERAVDLL